MHNDYVIEMLNIRKEFPGIVANDDITLQLRRGEIHALLGENGADVRIRSTCAWIGTSSGLPSMAPPCPLAAGYSLP